MKNVHQQIDDVEKGIASCVNCFYQAYKLWSAIKRLIVDIAKSAKAVSFFYSYWKEYGFIQALQGISFAQDPTPSVC